MLRIILLLSPVYVSLFWALALTGNIKTHSAPRLLLSKFMFLAAFCFFAHFLYFEHYSTIYTYFDVALQLVVNFIFPAFYIYFRLLTVDEKLSFKAHARYLLIPVLLGAVYGIGVFFTPGPAYKTWLFNEQAYPDSPTIQFLNVMRLILRIQFLVTIVITLIGSYQLIRKYGAKAEQFYSDIQDGKNSIAKMLIFTIFYSGMAALAAIVAGRQLILAKDFLIITIWFVFSVALYLIGYLGIKQKPVNPTFDTDNSGIEKKTLEAIPVTAQNKIRYKILMQFEENKIHLNSQLNIMDVVEAVGTNRSYISSFINQQYNQNFCSFVNSYRLEELERVILQNPDYSYETLAESCGFGSVNSLKRAISARTGLSMTEWKEDQLSKKRML
ncbi:MAG: helix-turn-helix domain-containing protein [Bacteroidota bacterium]|nr:helix-turn-helix domain-containing protein [Bacteroidota bacterium]